MELCVCGMNCEACPSYGLDCGGCETIEGKVYWAGFVGVEVCPVYKCARDKSYKNCGECSDLPCELWFSLQDPSQSEEEHLKSVNERIAALKK